MQSTAGFELLARQGPHNMSQPRTVFLDQNHWIYLARAVNGRPKRAEHLDVAAELLKLVERDEIRLPLSILHLIEHAKAPDAQRRSKLAEVFENYSRGWFFANGSDVRRTEILRAVSETFHCPPPAPPHVVGRGFLFGIGSKAREHVANQLKILHVDEFALLTELPGALLDLLTFSNEEGRAKQNALLCLATITMTALRQSG